MNKEKIKVGFYLENEGYPSADLRFPEKGNPGIGGTQFTTLATAYYLNKYYPELVDILLIANSTEYLPASLNTCHALNVINALIKSEQEGCDIFVFKSEDGNHEIYQALKKARIKTIARSNNSPDRIGLYNIARCSQIKAHVCVGQEQLDILRDHPIFNKSTRIFHAFNSKNFVPQNKIDKRGNTVVFIGSLIPAKGFHYLAKIWPQIIEKKPDAKLIVIGSGRLYNRNNKLGRWGLAEENYEDNYIRPFLSDKNGNPIESVHFAGLLGEKKIEILQNADIGIANPSGSTETFCSSAVEIQACGTPVISAAEGGLLDTVEHAKTGLLVRGERELIKSILYLLNNPEIASQFGKRGIEAVERKFSHKENAKEWLELLINIHNDQLPQPQSMKKNYFYKAKILREIMRISKKYVPVLRTIPSLIEIQYLRHEYFQKIQ